MTHSLDNFLVLVAEKTFERLAFMFAVPEEEAPDSVPGFTAATVAFDGPFQGQLVIAIADQMLPVLATNMLGVEEESSPVLTQQYDALKELANVVCGNLLPEIAGPQAEFHVGAPELNEKYFAGGPASGQTQAAEARLIMDGGEVKLALFLDNDAVVNNAALFTNSSQASP